MSVEQKCPIWGTLAQVGNGAGTLLRVDSPRTGGSYRINVSAEAALEHVDDAAKARLTTWLLEQKSFGDDWPLITEEVIDTAKRKQPLSVNARADRLLELLAKKTPNVGSAVFCASSNHEGISYPYLAHTECINDGEIRFLSEYLIAKHWVVGREWYSVVVTVEGYSRLADLATKHVSSLQAFVAMWFDPSMSEAFNDGIKPGISDAGYEPVRLDQKEHNNKIDDEIIAEIRRSRFLVADFTHGESGARGGVYYEAGFAQGINIPVIFACRKDFVEKVHFDTRQYNHIPWENPQELRTRLSQRISATIGDGPFRRA